jgi:16S rRNA (cytosine967-C5)-methyltransferase
VAPVKFYGTLTFSIRANGGGKNISCASFMAASNPRICCLKALQRWESSREFADGVLHRTLEQSDLPQSNRAFVTETFYGVIRNRTLLDFVIRRFRANKLDAATRQVLRLGLYQLYKMRIPAHAAVYETVNIAGPARTLVNAILRKSIAEKEAVLEALEHAPVHVRYSHPEFLYLKWQGAWGETEATQLCAWNNQPAKIYVRANELRVTPGELLNSFPSAKPLPGREDCIEVEHLPSEWISAGVVYVQDPSTLIPCELLAPQPGERVLDACAAPGGKTCYLAQLMQNRGKLFAGDYEPLRLTRLQQNLVRLGVTNTEVILVDWLRNPLPGGSPAFDAILVDAPCSNTGVIRRRTDVRWRLTPDDFRRMSHLQFRMVESIVPYLRPGGRMVYSTCSIESEENEQVVSQILNQFPQLVCLESRKVGPLQNNMDGAFAALFRKE